jgi:tripartite-type tricarboxylate transporter receptor subunit TctC
VVALAVSTPQRAGLLPDVPTVVEAGYPAAQYLFWCGLAFPKGTPRAIVDKLHRETTKALGDPVVKEKLSGLGTEARTMSVDEFTKFVRDDVLGTVKLAKDANLTPTN